MEHLVETGRAPDFCRCQVDELRYMLDPVRAQVAVLLLEQVQDAGSGRNACAGRGDELSRSHHVLVVEPCHG